MIFNISSNPNHSDSFCFLVQVLWTKHLGDVLAEDQEHEKNSSIIQPALEAAEISSDMSIRLLLGCCFCSLAQGSTCTTCQPIPWPSSQNLGYHGSCRTRARLTAVPQLCGELGIIKRTENWYTPEGLFPQSSPAINMRAVISKSHPPDFFLADVWILFSLHSFSFAVPGHKLLCTAWDEFADPGSALSRVLSTKQEAAETAPGNFSSEDVPIDATSLSLSRSNKQKDKPVFCLQCPQAERDSGCGNVTIVTVLQPLEDSALLPSYGHLTNREEFFKRKRGL